MPQPKGRSGSLLAVAIAAITLAGCRGESEADAQQGVTGDTILIGSSMPFSGPVAVFGLYAKGVEAYFEYINATGGVHGRKLKLKVYDDGYEPGRTLQNAKKLVESDRVFAVGFVVGTAHNLGIRQYMNDQKVPQVLANTGHPEFGDPASVKAYPWTTAWLPPYELESFALAGYLKERQPQAKVAILNQNDDLGKSLLAGFEKAIQGSDIKVVAQQVYTNSDASVAGPAQVLAQSGADAFLNWSSGTFTPQTISKMTELNWRPTTFLISFNTAISTLRPAGLENSKGFLAPGYLKSPTDPAWANDAGMKTYREIIAKYSPGTDADQQNVAYGFTEAEIFVTALKKAPKLTRQALMSSLRNMDNEKMTVLLPGIIVSTSEAKQQHWPINALGLREFDGQTWKDTGKVYSMRGPSS
jgi:branched-chain amino acid transport system substrate-binding protein